MNNANNRVNIINFVRGVEPRLPIDLLDTLKREIALVNQYELPATWLIQYDALIDPQFTDVLKELDDRHEIGIWFEVVQPLTDRAGLAWHGRYPWDWHANVGFSIGYTPDERVLLADLFMEEFHRQFGYYPRSAGSWFMDAHLLGHLSDRYGIVASCNCKDQWGTDGYTLWGGYYNQAYYPSRLNGFMPAQTAKGQIPVPVFRMLGSDPIYQYDAADYGYGQSVITLEPVYTGAEGGGGNPEWVRWFFDTSFGVPQLSFGYTQIGQENSFGWERISAGLIDQIALLADWQREERVRVETLAESGAWFKETYPVTPASSIIALKDWRNSGKQSLWYCSRFYRVNLLKDGSKFCLRDVHLFDENYEERYLRDVCETEECWYDTLPVMDAGRWTDGQVRPGIVPVVRNGNGEFSPAEVDRLERVEADCDRLALALILADGTEMAIAMEERSITIRSDFPDWGLQLVWGNATAEIHYSADRIKYMYEGMSYGVDVNGAMLIDDPLETKDCKLASAEDDLMKTQDSAVAIAADDVHATSGSMFILAQGNKVSLCF
ncbi:hypothetical protein [Paenibacillus sp. PAMC21692]|uniref:hypothetical protein n=1 Tax=Paenibacillus sp. PAMC21692 TaxID=2762320 RepID=UPI00164E10E7|nr:hypothetical protein [Paenibacillus sp. PAMC21692]QNK56346.1 hypothetical protein H7F31_27975 [Paenibacillus sp. PAMC21692]